MRRSNTVRIIAGKETKAKLKALGKAFVNCWNEVNKLRLEQYKRHEPVDFAKTEKIVYEKYKAVLHGAINILHIPESDKDRGKWLKAQPVVYRWTNGAGWVKPTSYEAMKMKAVNHEPMIRLEGTIAF